MEFFQIEERWAQAKWFLKVPEVEAMLVRHFGIYTSMAWGIAFHKSHIPAAYETDCEMLMRRSMAPESTDIVATDASSALVSFYLTLVQRMEPTVPWRILHHIGHSLVWDGQNMLFDPIMSAKGVCPSQAFAMARPGRELEVGRILSISDVRDGLLGVTQRSNVPTDEQC